MASGYPDYQAFEIPVSVPSGGTGAGTWTLNGVLYGRGVNTLGVTAAGAPDEVLRVPGAGGAPAFGAVDLAAAAAVTGLLPVAHGGSGSGTPSLVAGTGITITGSWPNNTIALTTPVAVANGGTGTATGSITGTGALTFAAGGSNQNVTLTPSGTGCTILGGKVGIGTTPTQPLDVLSSTGAADLDGVLRVKTTVDRVVLRLEKLDGIASTNPIFSLIGDNVADKAFMFGLSTDSILRYAALITGETSWGPGGASARDVRLYRSGTKALTVDDNAGGAATLKAAQLQSTVATGTAPLIIASTTLVTNLNADLVDGVHVAFPLPVASGGTGTATPSLVAGAGISIAGSWPNNTITNTSAYATLADPLTVAHGGTGTATPSLVAGANIGITGSWPNQTVALNATINVTTVNASGSPAFAAGTAGTEHVAALMIGNASGQTGSAQRTQIGVYGAGQIRTVNATLLGVADESLAWRLALDVIGNLGIQGGIHAEHAALAIPLAVADGGNGTATPSLVAGNGIQITGTWPAQVITNTWGAVTFSNTPQNTWAAVGSGTGTAEWAAVSIAGGANITITGTWPSLTVAFSGILPIASGGTGTATPTLVAGANITITGTWPAQTIALTTPITGTFTVGDGAGPELMTIDGGATQWRTLGFMTGGSARWYLYIDDTAEAGSDAGSNFVIGNCHDNGGFIGSALFIRRSDGQVGIGTTVPKSALHVVGLPVYANNAAAVAGGLTAGAFYCTGGDPDPVCVVH